MLLGKGAASIRSGRLPVNERVRTGTGEVARRPSWSDRDQVRGKGGRSGKVHLLWIDDEISPSDSAVIFLQGEGHCIDCATTGAAGLAMARIAPYECILLDLRLPDMTGLSVLANLRAEGVSTPVLVLTGFGDFESARAAGRLGVAGFEVKPIFIDDLKASIERIVGAAEHVNASPSHAAATDRGGWVASSASLSTLLEALNRLAQCSVVNSTRLNNGRTVHSAAIKALSRALADPALPMPPFLACARALIIVRTTDRSDSAIEVADSIKALILETLGRPAPRDFRVLATLGMLESAAAQGKRVSAHEIAKTQNVHPSHLGRLVADETGFEIRDWRSGFLLRPSLATLAETNEHVKQIACHLLGFGHHAQFDTEFHRFFGMTPSEFRRFSRSISSR